MESVLGRIQFLGKAATKQKICDSIEEYRIYEDLELETKESNSYIFLTLTVNCSQKVEDVVSLLHRLVVITGNIENKVIGVEINER